MIKNFYSFLFVLSFASFVFVNNNVMADFSSRHSLMPTPVEEVESKPASSVALNEIDKGAGDDTYSYDNINYDEPVVVSSDGIMVDDGNESFFLKRPSASSDFSNSQFKDDFTSSGPKVDKPEGYDELMQMVRDQGGVIKPSSYADDGNGNLILKSGNVNNRSIVSNVIDEKKENVITRPLFVGKGSKEVKSEKSHRAVPVANLKPKKVETKTTSKSSSKPVKRRSSDFNEVEIYSSDKDFDVPYEDKGVLHVASYNTKESAEKGFDVISRTYNDARYTEPFINYEYVKGKGNYWRLYLLGDEKLLLNICNQMKSDGEWCNILK